MNVIPCTAWVKKGIAAAVPQKVELRPDELQNIIKKAQCALENEDEDSDENVVTSETYSRTRIVGECSTTSNDEYNFSDYDNESNNVHCHIANIATFSGSGRDPLVTNDDDDDSDREDDIIKSDDNLVLIGHVEGDASILEVFVYNEKEGSFYCHHDILLPSFPLCIEWLNYDPTEIKPSNLCAIGNMTSIIEIWDLDLIDCLEPVYKLGCKPSKKKKQKRIGHRDAVLDIAWNQNYTHILASGSVDQTVLLWDLDNSKPVTKLNLFNEKVQALKWHPYETHQLLTGCADKFVRLFDCKNEMMARSWEVSGEVERVLWDKFNENYCIASTDNGYIELFDVRMDKPVWQNKAHEKEVTGLCLSMWCQNLLVSGSNDGTIKVWDLVNHKDPTLVWEKKTNLGALQCLAASPDNGFVFTVGGDNKEHNFKVLDLMEIPAVRERFASANHVTSHSAMTSEQNKIMDVSDGIEDMDLENVESPSTQIKNKKKKT